MTMDRHHLFLLVRYNKGVRQLDHLLLGTLVTWEKNPKN